MRELKFRQWFENRMIPFGFIKDKNGYTAWICAQNNLIDKYPVMQFTGLQDGEGTDIYEGDIIHLDYNYLGNVVVRFLDGSYNLAKYKLSKGKVIGNICENPELLGEVK